METMHPHRRPPSNARRIWGIIAIVVGAILMANVFDLFPYEVWDIIWSWQMLLIGIGLLSLLNNESKFIGIVLIAVGLFFLVDDFWYFPPELRKAFWPAVLIIFGTYLVISPPKYFDKERRKHRAEEDHRDFIDEVSVFGGGEKTVTSNQFKGGKITSIFGGSKINLMHSELSTGENILDTFSLFGGSTIIVPAGWNIRIDVVSVFGGFSDKRERMPNLVFDQEKVLIIKGVAIFGGGDVKSFGL